MNNRIVTSNIILYCKHWPETLAFYRDELKLPIHFSNSWFVEFIIADNARLSVANEDHASIKSSSGAGITLSFEVADIELERDLLLEKGLLPGLIKDHAWNARVFYILDPEGHRIEFWQKTVKKE